MSPVCSCNVLGQLPVDSSRHDLEMSRVGTACPAPGVMRGGNRPELGRASGDHLFGSMFGASRPRVEGGKLALLKKEEKRDLVMGSLGRRWRG